MQIQTTQKKIQITRKKTIKFKRNNYSKNSYLDSIDNNLLKKIVFLERINHLIVLILHQSY